MKVSWFIFSFLIGGSFCQGDVFPSNFLFGVATSAYQIEGAWNVGEKSLSIWDYNLLHFPENVIDKTNGSIACDAYHKIDEDIKNLKDLNVDFYRFSISWPRLLKMGYQNYINEDGARYYNEVIDKLIANGIEPLVTLFHWDLPQHIQELGGWTNKDTVQLFGDYARVCFHLFGDRVKKWITVNEPTTYCQLGYDGTLAPFYESHTIGNYLCGHNMLLGHAEAYKIYKKEFKLKQKGKVGLSLESSWFKPKTESKEDIDATETIQQMHMGWFAHPLFNGDYPKVMRERIDRKSKEQGFSQSRLPKFTLKEILDVRGSLDFFGLNHYSPLLVSLHEERQTFPSYFNDVGAIISTNDSWTPTARDYFKVLPEGIRQLLKWIKKEYGNKFDIIITENGYAGFKNETTQDDERISYYNGYLKEILKSINKDKMKIIGYTAWSYMDNFEWSDGYTMKFGMFHVDFNDPNRPRTPKNSACVYKRIINTKTIDESYRPSKCVLTSV